MAALTIGTTILLDRGTMMVQDGVWTVQGQVPGWPAAPGDARKTPLGTPPDVAGSGSYAFLRLQDGSDEPVTYDPCVPIHVEVNPRSAFEGSEAIVESALDVVSDATGLRFVIDGTTDRIPRREAPSHAVGGGWQPVLIAWSDPDEVEELEGDTIGIGGSAAVPRSGHTWFVSGTIALDGPALRRVYSEHDGPALARSVVIHELGHLVGLDHVEDEAQIMNPRSSGLTELGPGDRAGLARLGNGVCASW